MKKITFWTQLGRFSFSFRIKVLVSALTFLLFSFSVHAQHPYGFMDGNVMNDNGQLDWQDVYNNSGLPAGSISTGIQFDVMNPDDIFTGGSTKDHLPISGWFNKFQDASSSDKTNILQAGAILIDGKIYFFGNRFSNEGATNIGFWFFQDDVNVLNGTFEGDHQVGDILVVAEISNGGAVGKIAAYEWRGNEANGGTIPSSEKSLIKIVDEDHPQPNVLAAIVNSVDQPTPWSYQGKGEPDPNVMPPISFFEGFINIAGLNLTNACFSSFLVETRSSFSINAILEDFIGSNFNVQPLVSIDDITDCDTEFPKELTAQVTGGIGPFTFQWKKDGTTLGGESSSSISVTEAGTYSVIVTGNGIGGLGTCDSEADTAEITILESPEIVTTPLEACEVGATAKATFTLEDGVTDSGGGSLQFYSDSGYTTLISDADNVTSGTQYLTGSATIYVRSTNEAECVGESSFSISVNLNPSPSVGDQAACDGDTNVVFSTASVAGYSYQWYVDTGSGYTELGGETGNSLTLASVALAMNGNKYKVIATDENNATNCTGEDFGTLTVNANPSPSVGDQAACDGDTNVVFSTASVAGYTYQWYVDTGSGYTELGGETGNSLTLASVALAMNGNKYKVIATDENNATNCTGEDFGTLTVNANPTPSVGDQAACDGDTNVVFSTASVAGYSYQWYVDTGSGYTELGGETGNSLTLASVALAMNGNKYKVIATDENNATNCTGEDFGTLTVNANPSPSVGDQAACDGDTNVVFSTASVAGYTYQWYVDTGSGYTELGGETGNSLTLASVALAMNGNKYKVIATDENNSTNCTGEDFGTLTVNANPSPSVGDQASCDGDTNVVFSTASVSGYTYQWYVDTGSGYTELGGETGNSLTLASVALAMNGNKYKVIATDENNATNCTGEDFGTLTVNANPSPSVGDQAACDGDTSVVFSTASVAGYTYQWYVDTGSGYIEMGGETGNSLTLTSVALAMNGNKYKVIATDENNSTNCTGEDFGTLTVNAIPSPSVGDQAACDGDTNVVFSTAAVAGYTYQWYVDTGSGYTEMGGETGNSLTLASVALAMDGNKYKVIATDENNSTNCTGEDFGTLTVSPLPTITLNVPFLDCFGDTPSVAVLEPADKSNLEFKVVRSGDDPSAQEFEEYVGPFYDLIADSDYTIIVRNVNTLCINSYDFRTPSLIDDPIDPVFEEIPVSCVTGTGGISIPGEIGEDPFNYFYYLALASDFDPENPIYEPYPEGGFTGLYPGDYLIKVVNSTYCDVGTFPFSIQQPECMSCETAFAKLEDDLNSYCFIDERPEGYDFSLDFNANRWGWTNFMETSDFTEENGYTITLDLYAGAGQCDTSKGELAGYVEVYYNEGSVNISYHTVAGYWIEGVHTYVGEEPYMWHQKGKKNPPEYTVAPGQYPFNSNGSLDYNYDTSVSPITLGGVEGFYVIAHADVCKALTSEYNDKLLAEAQDQYIQLNRRNNTIIYSPKIAGGKTQEDLAKASPENIESLEVSREPKFDAYPVPFRDNLNIGYKFDYTSDVTIQIFNMNGQLLKTYQEKNVNASDVSQLHIDFERRSSAVYIVRMITDREVFTRKIISDK
ncbi:MAG: T9SS type A sorting domain-containing protein [Christiangramia sp.]|uniref:T9SS type A sorting domain-containing protein n=1 Tax=Christiangramia sp. TaxID=1931228 RepID=UPI003241F9AA